MLDSTDTDCSFRKRKSNHPLCGAKPLVNRDKQNIPCERGNCAQPKEKTIQKTAGEQHDRGNHFRFKQRFAVIFSPDWVKNNLKFTRLEDCIGHLFAICLYRKVNTLFINAKNDFSMKRFFYLMVLLLLFSAGLQSCGDDFAPIENSETLTAATDTSTAKPRVVLTREERVLLDEWANKTPKLSKEQAAEIADNFFGNESSVSTLSKFGSFAPQCEVLVRSKHKLSKSNDGHELLDTMLYVFNYDDGYAVVSAEL